MTPRQAEICKQLETLQKQQLGVLTPTSADNPQVLSFDELKAYGERHDRIKALIDELEATLR